MSELPPPAWRSTSTELPEFWSGPALVPEPEDEPSLDLWGAVGRERPWATVLLVFSWGVVFAAMGLAGGTHDAAADLRWGGLPSAWSAAAAWRWLAYTAVHGGIAHIASNAFVMLVLGSAVERIFTRAHFFILFAGGALAGAAGTLVWEALEHPDEKSITVGASGAIFALGGALLMGAWRLRHRLAPSRARALAASVLWLVVPGLVVGFQEPHVGNAAHVAGFVAGVAAGAALGLDSRLGERGPSRLTRLGGAAAALALAACYTIGFASGASR